MAARQHEVRLDAGAVERPHGVLRRLGLHFAGVRGHGQVTHQDGGDVTRLFEFEHAGRFQKQDVLVLADRAADFDHDDVRLGMALGGLDAADDFFRHVRHHLHRAAAVLQVALAVDDGLVDAAGRHVVDRTDLLVEEAFVVADVLVRLVGVMRHEDFAMFHRVHGAGVDVDVGIDLDGRDAVAVALENAADRGAGHALADARDDAAGDEYIFRHIKYDGKEILTVG